MTLSGAKARFQLNATATPTGVNATGPNVIGQGLGSTSFSDADIVYSFTVTATGAGGVATLTLSTGAIVKTTGTPDVTRWGSQTNDLSAVDFEGVALPTMVTLYGVHINSVDAGGFRFIPSSDDIIKLGDGDYVDSGRGDALQTLSSGHTVGSGTVAIDLEDIGTVTITIIGKSS